MTNNSIITGSILDTPQVPEINDEEREKTLRSFGDIGVTRQRIFDNALQAAQQLEPVSNSRYTLQLADVKYEGPEEYSLQQYRDAILRKNTLARSLRGTWNLVDNATGQVLEQKRKTVAKIPYLSPQGTFVLRGNDYALSNQFRLRPGVFTRLQDNGELESHVNVAKGRAHRLYLDPETGIFRIKIEQARIPLIDALKVLGVEDAQIEEAWGKELTAINKAKRDPKALTKLYLKFTNKQDKSVTADEKVEAIRAAFADMVLDEEVTAKTLGRPHKGVTADTLLDITKKLLRVSKGEDLPDSRDDLAYQTVWGPEDLIAERLKKSKQSLTQLLWKVTNKNSLANIPTGVLTDAVNNAIMSSGLGSPIEEVNPAEIFDHLTRITRMGEGGIPSVDAVPDEARSVQPSQLGFVDFLRTPECYDGATEVMTDEGWKFWPEVNKDTKLACLVRGKLEFNKPIKLIKERFWGYMQEGVAPKLNYLVTLNHRMLGRDRKEKVYSIKDVKEAKKSDLIVPISVSIPWINDTSAVDIEKFRKDISKGLATRIPKDILHGPLSIREEVWEEFKKASPDVKNGVSTDRLALYNDLHFLAFSIGKSVKTSFEFRAVRSPVRPGLYIIKETKYTERSFRLKLDYNKSSLRDLPVYCAEVPGGLLYVRRGGPNKFGFWCGNSSKVGVDLRLASAARKGEDGRIYIPVVNKDGKRVYRSPQELANTAVAFPGETFDADWLGDGVGGVSNVPALVNGSVKYVPKDQVEYFLPEIEDTFSPLSNLIPLKSRIKGQRAVMAARMLTQALPVRNAEAPLVQAGVPGQSDKSFESVYGDKMGALRAEKAGRVISVDKGSIKIKDIDGNVKTHELYQDHPYNRKTSFTQFPSVKPGDIVQPNQLIATSNFTNKDGDTALGLNARVMYLPFRGLNFEDAIVISESFAKRMESEQLYQNDIDWDEQHKLGKNNFASIFPKVYDRKILENFTDDGLIKPGTVVKENEPLILAVREKQLAKKLIHRGHKSGFEDASLKWEHSSPGVVIDSVMTPAGANVTVKAYNTMQVGDKLSGRYGDKGVVSAIIPDEELPTMEDGSKPEVLVSPLGIISRTNPSQVVEAALGKIAAKTGKPYKIHDFDNEDLVEFALQELKKNGLKDKEDVIDPETGRKIEKVFTGSRFYMKLHHTAEAKGQGRGLGGYSVDMTPAKGGAEGAKRIGMLEVNSLLSGGATQVLRDAKMIRGQANPDFWRRFVAGHNPMPAEVPYTYKKFINQLKASGINVVPEGEKTHIMALTDKDIDHLSEGREITGVRDPRTGLNVLETVDWQESLEPRKNGLFDKGLTGGHLGNKWAHIKLSEPLPNPVMEEPIRRILDLTEQQFLDIISGKKDLNGIKGPEAITQALKTYNLKAELARAQIDAKSEKKTYRDKAIRKLGYLKSAERLGIEPKDWILTKVPVIPPMFRPISLLGPQKLPWVDDPNYLYKELFDANEVVKGLRDLSDDEEHGANVLNLYKAFKGVTGLGDPTQLQHKEKHVKGFLKHIFGSSPKVGTVQRKLLGSTTDLVGRAVIAPDPNLDMDQVGLPEEKAWTIYKPFIMRSLRRQGYSTERAMQAFENKEASAKQSLLNEMENRPVIINRAPTLHRFGILAAKPILIKGEVLKVSPLIVGGFGADFDGDAMQYHVPVSDDAVQEAYGKLLPSRNLLSVGDFTAIHRPGQDYAGGLYEASAGIDMKRPPMVYKTTQDAIAAFRRGEINADRRVEILEER